MDKENNIIIAYTLKAEAALLDIEKKYNLEESDEEWVKKLKEHKLFNRSVVSNLCRKFFTNEVSEKNFIDSLQKDLKINNETAKKIFKDAIDNIIPFLIKTSEEEIKKGVFQNADDKSQQPIQPILAKPIRLIKEEKPINTAESPNMQNTASPPKINPKIDKRDTVKKRIEKITTEKPAKEGVKKQTDTYREPIE